MRGRPRIYLAAVIDLFSRRVVGWSMSAAMAIRYKETVSIRYFGFVFNPIYRPASRLALKTTENSATLEGSVGLKCASQSLESHKI
jgi:hypothetical protein